MRRSPRLLVAAAAGAFVALAVLAVGGGLGRDDAGIDPARTGSGQWNLDAVRAPTAWQTTRGAGVTVAVIDSGVDARHPELRDRVIGGADCVSADGDPASCRDGGGTDPDGHGTHVAGILAATADNGRGIAGVAPEVDLLTVRALTAGRCARRPCGGDGQGADVAAAVRWAVGAGAEVVNLSLRSGAGGTDPDLAAAIDEAWAAGVIVVVAGPNREGSDPVGGAPALIVTAVAAEDELAPYAAGVGDARWGIAAPGGEVRSDTSPDGCDGDRAVRSTIPVPAGADDAYGCLAGTSMAAPHVAGAAALLLATGLSPQETIDRLLATAVDLGLEGRDAAFGAGRLDLGAALPVA